MSAYYNEIEPYAAQWLRNLIAKGLIADGEVDTRSIVDVSPDDIRGFTQCHFFAGIGGWSHAFRLAGWPDDRPVWTGSCPCQPFSSAGQQKGQADERHLWPVFFGLIRACRPPVVMGEQVAAAVGKSWLDGVSADLENIGYATGAAVVPACAVNAPHRRDRLWFVADAQSGGRGQGVADAGGLREGDAAQGAAGRFAQHGDAWVMADTPRGGQGPQRGDDGEVRGVSEAQRQPEHRSPLSWGSGAADSDVADADNDGRQTGRGDNQAARHGNPVAAAGGSDGSDVAYPDMPHGERRGLSGGVHEEHAHHDGGSLHGAWDDSLWLAGADGKARRVKSGVRLLANGIPNRVGRLRAYGNAIAPPLAAEIIGAYMDVTS